jgi:hypothetical protein
VLGLVLLVIIILIAVSCSGGGGGSPSANPPTTPSATNSAIPVPCPLTSLKLTLRTNHLDYPVASTPVFTGVFSNTSSEACRYTFSPASETWTVTSGTPTIWTNKNCTRSQLARTVTIRAGGTRRVRITWDGKSQIAPCTSGTAVSPGTYVLRATLDGVTAATGAVFHITGTTP